MVTADDPRFDPAPGGANELSYEVRESRLFTECVFIDRDFYVQTISDADETVLAFSVTTRSRSFRPIYELPFRPRWMERRRLKRQSNYTYEPLVHVRLGHTRFAELDTHQRDQFAGPHLKISVGAHNWSYSEIRDLANPGFYQTIVLTASNVAFSAPVGRYWDAQNEIRGAEWPDPARRDNEPTCEALPTVHQFRRDTVITTYTVIGSSLCVENYPSTFGPHLDYVRTLP